MISEEGRTVKLDLEIARKIQFSMMPKNYPFPEYLEASGKIAYHNKKILYTGVNNEKLMALMESSVRVQ